VTVTVSDAEASASTSFGWTIVFVDTAAPSIPGTPAVVNSGGTVQLNWAPSTDDVGVVGYIVYRSDKGNSRPVEIGRTASTSFQDSTAPRGGQYFYSVMAYDAAGNLSEFSNSTKIRL
jgi:fibronectin type 3 domain-containing protein